MMKKLVFFFLLILSVTSCEVIEDKAPGESWEILKFTIKAQDWKLVGKPDELNSYYECVFNNIPELSSFVCSDGTVMGYLYQGIGSGQVQTPLPFTIPYGEGNDILWTETFTYDYRPGSIAFYVNYSDFNTSTRPKTSEFRVVLHW